VTGETQEGGEAAAGFVMKSERNCRKDEREPKIEEMDYDWKKKLC
jgi:hypothetical protein